MAFAVRGIRGLHHGPQREAVDEELHIRVPGGAQQLLQPLGCGRLRQRRGQLGVGQHAEQGFELVGVGLGVDAIQEVSPPLGEEPRHGLVGRDHELLDDLVPEVSHPGADVAGLAEQVEEYLGLGQVEVQGAALAARCVQQPGELHCLFEHGRNVRIHGAKGLALGLVVQQHGAIDLGVGQPGRGTNHRGIELGPARLARCGKGYLRDHDQPVHVRVQTAQPVGQPLREHGLHGLGEVVGVAALAGLAVQGRAGLNVVGHVGDGGPEAEARALGPDQHRVVEVPGLGAVDGDEAVVAQVASAAAVVLARGLGHGLGLGQDVVGKAGGDAVVDLDQGLLGGDVLEIADHFEKLAGPEVAVELLGGLGQEDVAWLNSLGQVLFRDHEAELELGIGGLAVAVQLAGEEHGHAGAAALQNADHSAFGALLAWTIGQKGHDHSVAVPGPAHLSRADEDVAAVLVVRQHEAHARALHFELASDAAHSLGQAECAPLESNDSALVEEFAERVMQEALVVLASAERLEEVAAAEGFSSFAERLEDVRRVEPGQGFLLGHAIPSNGSAANMGGQRR